MEWQIISKFFKTWFEVYSKSFSHCREKFLWNLWFLVWFRANKGERASLQKLIYAQFKPRKFNFSRLKFFFGLFWNEKLHRKNAKNWFSKFDFPVFFLQKLYFTMTNLLFYYDCQLGSSFSFSFRSFHYITQKFCECPLMQGSFSPPVISIELTISDFRR